NNPDSPTIAPPSGSTTSALWTNQLGPLPQTPPEDKDSAKTGIGIAGAVGINFITDTTMAYIHDEGVVDVHEANLSTDDASRLAPATGGLAIANQSGADNSGTFAGAFSLNQLNGTTLAFVDGPTLRVRKEPGDEEEKLTLTATREGDLIAAAAGIGAQLADQNAVTVAGSVGVNLITDDTEAFLRAVNTTRVLDPDEFDVEGATSLSATDTSSILSIGGGFAITISPLLSHSDLTLTLGVSGAGNVIENTVKAFIDDSALKSES